MEARDCIHIPSGRMPSGRMPSQKLGILSLKDISEDYEICLPQQIILITISKSRVEKSSIHVMIKEKNLKGKEQLYQTQIRIARIKIIKKQRCSVDEIYLQ